MRHEIIMPALGMAQDTGTLLAWHKSEGDSVTQGETLFEVETDKTTMEVEAPVSGFLVGISARDGDEVPVGRVIALITDSAEATNPKQDATSRPADKTPESDAIPSGKAIIMPVLGMAQDSGVLVGWNKEIGDLVKLDDILFEVETDKSVVEVQAGVDGYLVARLAAAGDDVPTGETIAIIGKDKSAKTIDKPYSALSSTIEHPVQSPAEEAPKQVTASGVSHTSVMNKTHASKPAGKLLASPKLKRLAHQAGYDLALLAATNLPQPYHARDFEALKQANESKLNRTKAVNAGDATNRLSAQVPAIEFDAFLAWASANIDGTCEKSVIATFAGTSLAKHSIVQIHKHGVSSTYATHQQFSKTVESEDVPDLIVYDLRGTYITSVDFSANSKPVISILNTNNELTLTLTCTDSHLTGKEAAVLLNNFAGRMADPIRHLF